MHIGVLFDTLRKKAKPIRSHPSLPPNNVRHSSNWPQSYFTLIPFSKCLGIESHNEDSEYLSLVSASACWNKRRPFVSVLMKGSGLETDLAVFKMSQALEVMG